MQIYETQDQFQREKSRLYKTLKETDEMAKDRIVMLQNELESQARFYKMEENAYKEQIEDLKEQINRFVQQDREKNRDLDILRETNTEYQV